MSNEIIGWVDEAENFDSNLIANGGWCVPSGLFHHMRRHQPQLEREQPMKVNITIEDNDTEVTVWIDNRAERQDRPEPPHNMSGEVVVPALARDRHRIAREMIRNGSDAALTALYGDGAF